MDSLARDALSEIVKHLSAQDLGRLFITGHKQFILNLGKSVQSLEIIPAPEFGSGWPHIIALMPNLRSLSIKLGLSRIQPTNKPNFEHMPRNLRHLDLADPWHLDDAFLDHLIAHPDAARLLETLHVGSFTLFENVIAALGEKGLPNLLSLRARFGELNPSDLPPSLTFLDANINTVAASPFHDGLKTLKLRSVQRLLPVALLPSSLTSYKEFWRVGWVLPARYPPEAILSLPRGLVTLRVSSDWTEQTVLNLPPKLTKLATDLVMTIDRSAIALLPRTLTAMGDMRHRVWGDLIADLPPNLTSIGLDGPSTQSTFIHLLPKRLTALKVDFVPGDEIIWPSTLRCLTVSQLDRYQAAILPSTLEELTINVCSSGVEPILLLPRGLRKLKLEHLQASHDSQRSAVPNVGWFAHLKHLEYLSIISQFPLPIEAFIELSTHLERLTIHSESIPKEASRFLPLSLRFLDLTINIGVPEPEFLETLPSRLHSFHLDMRKSPYDRGYNTSPEELGVILPKRLASCRIIVDEAHLPNPVLIPEGNQLDPINVEATSSPSITQRCNVM